MSVLTRRRVGHPVVLVVLAAVLLAACSAGAGADASAARGPGASPAPAIATAPAATTLAASPTPAGPPTPAASSAFATLSDDEGTSVVIPAQPQRIVSLTPAATEILFALGAGARVVAKVEDVADFPPEAHDLPVVATFEGVDVEKIVGLGPDLVIAGGNFGTPPDAVAKLRSLGIPVVVVYASDVEGALKDIDLIGGATGTTAAASHLTAAMRSAFDQLAGAVVDLPRPRVFYETGTGDLAVYGIADDSVYQAMVELAGAEPITTGSASSWEMPTEALIAADPEVIVLGDAAYGVTADQVAARPGWKVLTAVKEGAIRPVDDTVVTRPGPRLVAGLQALIEAIHPDAVLPSTAPAAP